MSWSFHAVGKPHAVLEKARKDLSQYPLMEPEETIKTYVLAMLEVSLLAYPESSCVKITASGSQSPAYDTNGTLVSGKFVNSLHVDLDYLHGFVE